MKAYQVFKGELDSNEITQWDLVATYLNKDKALEHANKIVDEADPVNNEIIGGEWTDDGKYWYEIGWTMTGICKIKEIEVIK